MIVAHLGTTRGGDIGAENVAPLDDAANSVQELRNAAVSVNEDIFVISHGSALAEPDDVRYQMEHTEGVHGSFGASSVERLPTERAIKQQVEDFKYVI